MGTKRVGWARIKSLINENTNQLHHARPKYKKFTATSSLLASESGQIILFGPLAGGLAADAILTLPSAADGLSFRVLYVGGAADAHDLQINTGSDTNFFIGGVTQHDPDDGGDDTTSVYSDNGSNSRCNLLTPGAGTWAEVVCDGTNWFITGTLISATDTGVVFADQ
jgi:hypothetical protein